jgi:tetratricopeptide (TPR) repeat protein
VNLWRNVKMVRVESKLQQIIIATVLFAVTVAVFWPARQFDFLLYDDTIYVKLNPHVHQGLTWETVKWAFTSNDCTNWHPLTWLSHLLDWELFANNAGKHHVTSLLLHALSGALLFFALKALTGMVWRSAFVAAVFALHPLRVESVAWISERKDVLSGLFFMLTLWAYARFANYDLQWTREKNASLKGKRRLLYLLTITSFALGLMAKPMLVTLPFVMLLLDYWPLKRVPPFSVAIVRRLLVEKIPFFALTAVSCALTVWAQGSGGAISSLEKMPLSARIPNSIMGYFHYLTSFVWPKDLASPYPYPGFWPASKVLPAVALLLALLVVAFILRRKHPAALVGYFWFLGMLIPVIGLVQVGAQAYADRYTYLPLIGLAIAVAWVIPEILARQKIPRFVFAIASVAILLGCIVATTKYLPVWRNTETLFTHTLQHTKNNAFAHNNLGTHFVENGRFQEAIIHANEALRIVPTYQEPHTTLAFGYGMSQRLDEALPAYERALKFEPKNAQLHNGYGAALAQKGRLEEARAAFSRAVEVNPNFAEARHNLGRSLLDLGRAAEAIPHLQEAIRLKPDYATAQKSLALALERAGTPNGDKR